MDGGGVGRREVEEEDGGMTGRRAGKGRTASDRWREAARDGFTVRRDKCQRWGVDGRGGGLRVEGEG